ATRLTFAARPRQKAHAKIIAAKKRPAALNSFGHSRLVGVETGQRSLGIAQAAKAIVFWVIPVGTPFPHIAGHIEKAKAIGGKRSHLCHALKAVLAGVGAGKIALPGVGQEFVTRRGIVAPAKTLAI